MRGENFKSGIEAVKKRALNSIDNILLNREISLSKALEFIRPFYIFGEPDSFKLSFEILKFLKYDECFDVSNKMNQMRLCFEYAYCVEKGVKCVPDLSYAVQIYETLLKESLVYDDRIKTTKILLRIAKIFSVRNEIEVISRIDQFGDEILYDSAGRATPIGKSTVISQQTLIYLLDGLSKYGDVKKIELFMLAKLLIYLSKETMHLKELAIKAYKLCYKLDCVTDLDYIYHYKVEAKLKKYIKTFNAIGRESTDFNIVEIQDHFSLLKSEKKVLNIYRQCHDLFDLIKQVYPLPQSIDLMKITSYVRQLKNDLKSEKKALISTLSLRAKR